MMGCWSHHLQVFALYTAAVSCVSVEADGRGVAITPDFPCPAKCSCTDGFTAISCTHLTAVEVSMLFADADFFRTVGPRLRQLSIVHSEFSDISHLLRLTQYSPLNLLEAVDVSDNKLERIEWGAPSLFENHLPSVLRLNLSGNALRSLGRNAFVPFPNVEVVDVGRNELFTIDWETFRLYKLRVLSLARNRLPAISDHMLRFTPSLEWLDLSHNQLSTVQSSSLFAAQRLKHVDFSYNRIQHFNYDSFSPLFQLEWLDLAFNNMSQLPSDLSQLIALRTLNMSGNPLLRLDADSLIQPMLQVLNISHCPKLRLAEAGALGKVPTLETLILSHNPSLEFISERVCGPSAPTSRAPVSSLFEVDMSHNSLKIIPTSLMSLSSRIHLAGNPLECKCMSDTLASYVEKIVDSNEGVACMGMQEHLTQHNDAPCSHLPLTPLGTEIEAEVGSPLKLYCAPPLEEDTLVWALPNGTQIKGGRGDSEGWATIDYPASGQLRDSHSHIHGGGVRSPIVDSPVGSPFLGGLFPPQSIPLSLASNHHSPRKEAGRVMATRESLRFETLLMDDSGEYGCTVRGRGRSPANSTKRLHLQVIRPNIALSVLEIGSHFASLEWNGTLKVLKASKRVQLSLDVKEGHSEAAVLLRAIQLSLHNPWRSYNVMRLRPLRNYTFCLVYRIRGAESDRWRSESDLGQTPPQPSSSTAVPILYEACTEAKTLENLNFWNSLSPTTLAFIMAGILLFCLLFCGRGLYLRFYIWHNAKLRARMNQSISGQGFLSHSQSYSSATQAMLAKSAQRNSSLTTDLSVTFKNHSAEKSQTDDEPTETDCSIALSLMHNSLSSSGSTIPMPDEKTGYSNDRRVRTVRNGNRNDSSCTMSTNGFQKLVFMENIPV